ncbi:MAG TPA: hypothetical protein VFE48_02960 [Methylomirabilota bacterium]|nr:hypothetical protein [Methylomirabilota bacterium]
MSPRPLRHPGFWLLAANVAALIAFVNGPRAEEHPMAALGILAFSFVHLACPACRIRVSNPLCPANIVQGYFWIQLVLVAVLAAYFGYSQGILPHLPSSRALDRAILIHVVAYVSFCLAYQCSARRAAYRPGRRGSIPGTLLLIPPFAILGVVGFLLAHGGIGGFIEYASSPVEERLRMEEAATLAGAAGTFLKHFLGFAVVLAWSWWLGRRRRRPAAILMVTAATVIALLVVNFNYNRGTMLGPILALGAAFSVHVRRIPFKAVIVAGVLTLSLSFVFGWYRSTDLELGEISSAVLADAWHGEDAVAFIQIYASGPQMAAYLIESVEGTLYYGKTLIPSLIYPVPVLGKPFREMSGPVLFNELIYGNTDTLDQIIPMDGELFINFHLVGVVLGGALLGFIMAWMQGRFVSAPNPVESYAWLLIALWTVFPGSLSVASQIYVYSFWPIYAYFAFKKLGAWNRALVAPGHAAVLPYR